MPISTPPGAATDSALLRLRFLFFRRELKFGYRLGWALAIAPWFMAVVRRWRLSTSGLLLFCHTLVVLTVCGIRCIESRDG